MTKKKIEVENLDKLKKELPNYFDKAIVNTNIRVIDKALCGGLENNDMILLSGEAGTGKTTIALQISRKLCSQGKTVLYLDSEGKVSKQSLETTEVYEYINENFIYIRESTFEKVEETLDKFINTGKIQYVIVDSLSGIVPDVFLKNDKKKVSITTNNSMYTSKPLGLFMQKYNCIAKQKNICFIFIQQIRQKIDMRLGSISRIAGPKACNYYPSQILKLSSIKSSVDSPDDNTLDNASAEQFKNLTKTLGIGQCLELEVLKTNKNNPKKKYPLYLHYGKGISSICDWIVEFINNGTIKKDGAYYEIQYSNKSKKFHGIKELYDFIGEHDDFIEQNKIKL